MLVDGCSALVAELSWFEEMAEDRGLKLLGPARPGTIEYRDLLERLDQQSVGVALTALWVIERVYLEAWRFASPGAESFRPYVAHWTEPAFESYVDALAAAADAAVGDQSVDDIVAEVLRAEERFWDTALTGDGS